MSRERPVLIDTEEIAWHVDSVAVWDRQLKGIYAAIPGMEDIAEKDEYDLSFQTQWGNHEWGTRAYPSEDGVTHEYYETAKRKDGKKVRRTAILTTGDTPSFSFSYDVLQPIRNPDGTERLVPIEVGLVSANHGTNNLTCHNEVMGLLNDLNSEEKSPLKRYLRFLSKS